MCESVFLPPKAKTCECKRLVRIPNQECCATGLHEKQMFCLVEWIKSLLNVCVVCVHACNLVGVCGRGGAHGCFLWENGRLGVRGQCLGGSQWGRGEVRFGANASQ